MVIPVDDLGRYVREPGGAYGPKEPAWRFTAHRKQDFFAAFMSGAQRLPNGNTLVCDGMTGTIFEVTVDRQAVWEYTVPATIGLKTGKLGLGVRKSGVFRAYRYGERYAGLAGKDLRPR